MSLLSAIQTEGIQNNSYESIADHLNATTTVANPEAQTQVPAPVSLEALLTVLNDDEEGNIMLLGNFGEWAGALKKSGTFTLQAELTSIIAASLRSSGSTPRTVVQTISDLIDNEEREALKNVARVLAADDAVSPSFSAITRDTVIAAMDATMPDPNYQANIDGPPLYESYGLSGPITLVMIQEALNS